MQKYLEDKIEQSKLEIGGLDLLSTASKIGYINALQDVLIELLNKEVEND